jgi:hypothetical protein
VRKGLYIAGAALLLLAIACGGGGGDDEERAAGGGPSPAPACGGGSQAAAGVAAGASAFPGEAPASPETTRIDGLVAAAKLPSSVSVAGRKDIPNDAPDYKDVPEVVARFRQFGRETGTFYLLSSAGAPRLTLSVNQYATADGAKQEFDAGKGNPSPQDRVDTPGLGDQAAGFRVRLGGAGPQAPSPIVISFTRGRYYAIVADTAAASDAPADLALDVACAIDVQLKANPVP